VHVTGDVELGVVDPAGAIEPERHVDEPPAEARQHVQPPLGAAAQLVEAQPALCVAQRRAFEDRDPAELQRHAGSLEPEERGVERRHAVAGLGAVPSGDRRGGGLRFAHGDPPSATTSPTASRTCRASRSGSSTAARSHMMARLPLSALDTSVTLNAAPLTGANAHIRSIRAPPMYAKCRRPGTLETLTSRSRSRPPKSRVTTGRG